MRRLIPHAAVCAAYLAIAIAMTAPLIAQLDTHLIGHPFGDAYEYFSMAWWLREAAARGLDPFYHSLIVYPDGASALWLWSAPLQSLPTLMLGLVMPLTAAFNLAALLTLMLNGWAMFVLLRALLPPDHPRRNAAAFVGGIIWLTLPHIQGHLGAAHTGLITLWGAPLWVAALLRLRAPGDRRAHVRRIALAALLFPLTLVGNPTLVITLIAPLALLLWLTSGAAWRRTGIALIAGGIIWLPLAAPFALEAVRPARTLAAEVGGQVRYSAPVLAIASPAVGHPLWGGLAYPRAVVGVEPFELTAYLGLVTAGLCAIGVIARRTARAWLVLAIVAWVASLGALLKWVDAPVWTAFDGLLTGITLPWAALQDVPGISLARTPARFNLTVGFAAAVMAGYGAAALMRRRRTAVAWGGALLLSAAIAFDAATWFPIPRINGHVPENIRALGALPDVRAVLNLPIAHPLTSKEALFLQTGHGLPILTGHVTRRTPIDPAKAALLEGTLDPALLDAAGADVIIVHRAWADPAANLEARLTALAGDPLYADDAYAVYRLPPYAGDAPGWMVYIPPDEVIARDPLAIAVYAQAERGTLFTLALGAPDGVRTVVASMEGAELARWTIEGEAEARVWLVFPPGYHRVTLALDPPCPVVPTPALRCAEVVVRGITVE